MNGSRIPNRSSDTRAKRSDSAILPPASPERDLYTVIPTDTCVSVRK